MVTDKHGMLLSAVSRMWELEKSRIPAFIQLCSAHTRGVYSLYIPTDSLQGSSAGCRTDHDVHHWQSTPPATPHRLSQQPNSPRSAQGEPQTAIWPRTRCFSAGRRTLSSSQTPGVKAHETEEKPGHGFTAVKAINTDASLKSRRRMIFLVLKRTFCIISKCSDAFFCLTSTLMAQHQEALLPSQLLQDKY